ncbi:Placenta-specific protein 9 [Lemmus lemmus]
MPRRARAAWAEVRLQGVAVLGPEHPGKDFKGHREGRGVKRVSEPAAESPGSSREDLPWGPGCDRHVAIQGRLDIMEETVEKTVEHLEAEVTGLLGLLEELASNLPPGPFSPEPDLLGGDHF